MIPSNSGYSVVLHFYEVLQLSPLLMVKFITKSLTQKELRCKMERVVADLALRIYISSHKPQPFEYLSNNS